MRALVTGAAGFVGPWLCRRLVDDGAEVIAVTRQSVPENGLFQKLGLTEHPGVRSIVAPTLSAIDIDAIAPHSVFHLAGMSQIARAMSDPIAALEANARATWLLLDALRRGDSPPAIVVASSDAIYGETGGRAASEDDPLAALGPYEVSKIVADLTARSFARTFGLPLSVARLGNIYGPGDANTARLVPSLAFALATAKRPVLRGGGRAVRSYLHIEDCVDALLVLAARAGEEGVRGEAFNIAAAVPRTTLEMATLFLDVAGRPDLYPEIEDSAPDETSFKLSNSARARDRLGWRETRRLEDGLREVAMAALQ